MSDNQTRVVAMIDNPFWEEVEKIPNDDDLFARWSTSRAPTTFRMDPYVDYRRPLANRYSWAIASPGDIEWIVLKSGHRPLLDVGAGTGYWAWLLTQAGIDVIACDLHPPDESENSYHDGARVFVPVHTANGAAAVRAHPDRLLFLCWPPYNDPMAARVLSAYSGDALFFVGEGEGGCTANDDFFQSLHRDWELLDESPHHITWSGIHSRLEMWGRR